MIVLALAMLGASSITGCIAIDGDTLRCGRERVRLLAIDAPEMGKCRVGRKCVAGDPLRSKTMLTQLIDPVMVIERVGTDRYGRTLAMVRSKHGDLSCAMLRRGGAEYRRDWDNGGRVARTCPVKAG